MMTWFRQSRRNGADEPLTERILPWALRCRFDFLDANRLNPLHKFFPVDPVTIAQKIPWFAAVGKGLDNLLTGPSCGGMFRYIEMHDAPAIMFGIRTGQFPIILRV
jgi:hypothetical protein